MNYPTHDENVLDPIVLMIRKGCTQMNCESYLKNDAQI